MNPKNIYLFYGEDNYSATKKCRHWAKEFEKKYGEMNLYTFEGKNLTAEEFLNAAESVPFLSEKKMVAIEDFLRDGKEQDQKKIAEKLDDLADFCLIIFLEKAKPDARTSLFKKISKIGKVEEFMPLIGQKLVQWIHQKMSEKGRTIGKNEASLLAEMVGPNLWQMEQEIEKLSLYGLDRTIDVNAIEQLVSPNLSASVFKLTDYLAQKKPKESLKIFQVLIGSGEDPLKIFHMIVRQFRLLIQISDCLEKKMNKTEIIQKMKEHPFVVTTMMSQAKNFTIEQLKNIYQKLLAIDSGLKDGKIKMASGNSSEFYLALEKFMLECREQ
jgi:DNA polymerase-3 subunit delta